MRAEDKAIWRSLGLNTVICSLVVLNSSFVNHERLQKFKDWEILTPSGLTSRVKNGPYQSLRPPGAQVHLQGVHVLIWHDQRLWLLDEIHYLQVYLNLNSCSCQNVASSNPFTVASIVGTIPFFASLFTVSLSDHILCCLALCTNSYSSYMFHIQRLQTVSFLILYYEQKIIKVAIIYYIHLYT